MKYKAIIFDMDGTITDSEHIWMQATKDLITSKGILFSDDDHAEIEHQLKGNALHASCTFIKETFNLKHEIEELIAEKQKRAVELIKQHVTFIDGFEQFHKQVITKDIITGIATNADDASLQAAKEKLNLENHFGEHIYNISHVNYKAKPHPDLYLHTAQKLGVAPEYCVAIEDSATGVRAAKHAGMFCVGINTAKNREALHESDLIIDHYDEIELERLLHRNGIKNISI